MPAGQPVIWSCRWQSCVCWERRCPRGSRDRAWTPSANRGYGRASCNACAPTRAPPTRRGTTRPAVGPEFESPLFLDCCGLVRRALMDLRAELGFSVGPWNQAYLYDTLPLDVSGAADMQPGDLVFTTATYFNPKAKRHPHGVVHVEVWAGDGERTVAARWRRGRVQEFPSYRFDSAAYGDARYHFRSISTWLQGVCVSHCSEHAWGRCRRDFPGPKSIFCPDEGAEREDAGHVAQTGPQQKQHEQQQQHRGVENSPPPPPPSHDQWLVTTKPADSPPHGNNNNDDNDEEEESSGFQHSSSALLPLQEVSAEKQQTLVGSSRERRRRHRRASTCEPSVAPAPVRRAAAGEGGGGGDDVDGGGGRESSTRSRRDARGVRADRRTWEVVAAVAAVGGGSRAAEEEDETPGWPQGAAKAPGGGRTGLPGDEFGLATVTLAVALTLEAIVVLLFVVFAGGAVVDARRVAEVGAHDGGSLGGGPCGEGPTGGSVHPGARRGPRGGEKRLRRAAGEGILLAGGGGRGGEGTLGGEGTPGEQGTDQAGEGEKQGDNEGAQGGKGTRQGGEGGGQGGKGGSQGGGKRGRQGGEGGRPGRLGETRSSGPFFYIGGNNGAALVSEYCLRRGWERTSDRTREDYRLKWCELKSRSAYTAFREGQQLLYQIQNNKVLTSKIGLLCSLRDYERIISKLRVTSQPRMLKMEDFFPHTLRLDVRGERDEFFDSYQEGEKWICKPTGLNQGRGIFLLRSAGDVAALRERLLLDADVGPRTPRAHVPQARIVQRYVTNPLLLDGRKFDVRSYMLIASAAPPIVLFRHGYARLSCQSYSPESNDLTAHLTNQYMQKKSPVYQEVKEETVWTMSRFNDHVNEHCAPHKGLPKDWVLTTFTKRMQQVMTHCFLATKSKLEGKLGLFDLIGCDFLIDEDFKVWLLEMNCNPALQTNCMVLKEVIPQVVNETLDLALETFEKVRRGQRVMPLQTRRDFTLLYNGDPSDPHSRPSWPSSRPYLNLGLLVPRQKQQHQQNHHQQQHQQQQQQRRATKSAARNFALPEPRTPKPRIRYNISIAKVAAPPLQKLSLRPQGVEDDDDEDREEDEEDEAEERGGATLGAITRRVGCSKSARRPLKSAAAPRPTPPDPRHHRWALTLRSRAPAASLSSLSARGGVRSVAALAATISVLTTSFPHEASATWKTALSLPVQKAEEEAEEEEEEQEEEVDSQKLPPLPSPDDASPATTAQKQLSERGA
ncbi:inactive polyglycylase TTLL10 [Lampetra planeri]